MAQFTDQRAIRRYGPGFARARDILSVAMVVAEADGRSGEEAAREVTAAADRIPGMGRLDRVGLEAAGASAAAILVRDGVEAAFDATADRLDARDASAALLLACEVAGQGGTEGETVLRPMARRLGIGPQRLAAIRVLAERRRATPGAEQ